MGLFLMIFQHGALLDVFCMHAATKPPEPLASLVSVRKSPFTLAIRACIVNNSPLQMATCTKHREPPVWLPSSMDWGCRPRYAAVQAVAVQVQSRQQGAEQITIPIGDLRFTGIASMAGGLLYFKKFPLLPLQKRKLPRVHLHVPSSFHCFVILLHKFPHYNAFFIFVVMLT